MKHISNQIDIQQGRTSIIVYHCLLLTMNHHEMKPTSQPRPKTKKQETKEKPEIIVEKIEGGILVRRYKGKKVDVE